MARPFRFAVQLSGAASGPAWRDKARKVEDLGYSTLYVPDHLDDQWGPLVAMALAAESTQRLNVGALVLDNDFRHPVVLAKEAATLDLASEGRLELGLGAGWMRGDYEQSGVAFDPPGVRIERMVEGLTVMRQLWRDGRSDFAGRHYTVTGALGRPRPATPGGPKVVIGGGGRRMLSVAAREADIVGVNPNLAAGQVGAEVARSSTAELFRRRVAWVREAAGDRWDDLELQVLTFAVLFTDDARSVLDAMAPVFGLSGEEAAEVPLALVGTADQIVETLLRRREDYGFSYVVVHEPEMHKFARVVARLAGR